MQEPRFYSQDAIIYPLVTKPRMRRALRSEGKDALVLAAYLGSWLHGKRDSWAQTPEAHPGDDRIRNSLGWTHEQLDAAVAALENLGWWLAGDSAYTEENRNYYLQPAAIPSLENRPLAWEQDRYLLNSRREAMFKTLLRTMPGLSSNARLFALLAMVNLRPGTPSAAVRLHEDRFCTSLPGVNIEAAAMELMDRGIMTVSDLGKGWLEISPMESLLTAFWAHPALADRSVGHKRVYGDSEETVWERNCLAAQGIATLDRAERQRQAAPETEKWWAYALTDPRQPEGQDIFYIGVTSDPVGRERSHRESPGSIDAAVRPWGDQHYTSNRELLVRKRDIAETGQSFGFRLLSPGIEMTREQAEVHEESLVLALSALGTQLTNIQYLKPGTHPRDFANRAPVRVTARRLTDITSG